MIQRIQNNLKIFFDLKSSKFFFKKRFENAQDLLKQLNEKKIGIEEDNDLYDEISKEDITKLKMAGLVKELVIKEKKTK